MKTSLIQRLPLAVLLMLTLTACPSNTDSTDPSPTPSGLPTAETTAAASARPSGKPSGKPTGKPLAGVKRGIFILGEGLQIFKPCGGKEEIWVNDTASKDLETRYKALKLMDLEPVYVELTGEIKPTGKVEGFAADYKQSLNAQKVSTLRAWTSDGRCFPTDFVAAGAQPDWTLQVLRSGDVFFKSNEGEFPVVETLGYSAPKQEGNRWRYEFRFRTPDEAVMEAEFSEEACTQANKSYPYTAKLLFRGSTYTGCASKL